jgi:hypothetical protein
MEVGEDVCLWLTLASKFAIGGLDEPLSMVRVGPESASVSRDKTKSGLTAIADFIRSAYPDYEASAVKLEIAAARA